MSIIEQALRKLELSHWNEQQVASEYLKPTQVIATGGRHFPGPIWLAAGGLVVTAVVAFVSWPYLSNGKYFVSLMPGNNDESIRSVALPLPQPVTAPVTAPPANATVPGQSKSQGQVAASTQKSPRVVLDWSAATWVRDGAAAMGKNDVVGAVRFWSSGLEQLPGSYPLVILPQSASRASALALYNSLAGRYPVVLVEPGPPGDQQLGVMVVPERKEVAELMTDLRSTLKRKSLATTTVMAWRTTLAGNKEKSLPLAPAPGTVAAALAAGSNEAALTVANAGKPKEKGKVGTPAAAVTSEEDLDPARSVQGSAVSSADAILRRFTDVERLIAKGQFEAALDAVVQVESDVGETWQTRYLKGAAAKGLARWDEAISALTRAHQLNPLSVKVLLDRAICLQELGNHAAALDDLNLASALNPHMPAVVLNTGYSLDALGRRAEALREYKLYLDMTANRNEYAKVRAWVVKRVAR